MIGAPDDMVGSVERSSHNKIQQSLIKKFDLVSQILEPSKQSYRAVGQGKYGGARKMVAHNQLLLCRKQQSMPLSRQSVALRQS